MTNLSQNTMLLHTVMLNDRVRTLSFLNAIYDLVRPDDVVVDIGTGTGILAIAAVRAGARHVYAIESNTIGQVAQNIFEANGVSDRITLINGYSTKINLPEHADVLVSEIIGNDPLEERVLEIVVDARNRFLKPSARLLPCALQVFGLAVTIPESVRKKFVFTPQALHDWQSWYDIKFSPLAAVNRRRMYRFLLTPSSMRDWKTLNEPALLAEVDFNCYTETQIVNTTTITVDTSGEFSGLIVYFSLNLTPTCSITTHPALADKDNHWSDPVWVFIDPVPLLAGERFEVVYEYRAEDNTTWCQVNLLR
jgi:precorrin-6B methylase 2